MIEKVAWGKESVNPISAHSLSAHSLSVGVEKC